MIFFGFCGIGAGGGGAKGCFKRSVRFTSTYVDVGGAFIYETTGQRCFFSLLSINIYEAQCFFLAHPVNVFAVTTLTVSSPGYFLFLFFYCWGVSVEYRLSNAFCLGSGVSGRVCWCEIFGFRVVDFELLAALRHAVTPRAMLLA